MYEGKVVFDHFQFCSILSDIRSYKLKWLIEVLKMFKSLSAWKVLQNKVFINQEQSVLTKQGVYKRSMSPHVFFFWQYNTKSHTQLNFNMRFFLMSIYGHTKGYITSPWRVTLKRTVCRSVSLVTIVSLNCQFVISNFFYYFYACRVRQDKS